MTDTRAELEQWNAAARWVADTSITITVADTSITGAPLITITRRLAGVPDDSPTSFSSWKHLIAHCGDWLPFTDCPIHVRRHVCPDCGLPHFSNDPR